MEIDKSIFYKEVIVPQSGQVFKIRRVSNWDYMAEVGGMQVPLSDTTVDLLKSFQERVAKGGQEEEKRVFKFYITYGVVSPKIWFGEESECPVDQIYHLDLGDDLRSLGAQILQYSMTYDVKRLEHFFFRAMADNAGSNGAEVRAEAIEPSAG